jgi:hypothetical protein
MLLVLVTSAPSEARVAASTAIWFGVSARSMLFVFITARTNCCSAYASSFVPSGEASAAN